MFVQLHPGPILCSPSRSLDIRGGWHEQRLVGFSTHPSMAQRAADLPGMA